MPVDIRSFFQKKNTSNTSKKPASSSTTKKPAASADTPPSSQANAAKSKRKRQIAPEQETADEENAKHAAPQKLPDLTKKKLKSEKPSTVTSTVKPSAKNSSPSKRKRIVIDNDDDDDEHDEDFVELVDKPSASPVRRSSPRRVKQENAKKEEDDYVEVSASAYFSKKDSSSPPANKKIKSSPVKSSPAKLSSVKSSPSSQVKKESTATSSTATKKTAAAAKKKEVKELAPVDVTPVQNFSLDEAATECLLGLTFCITAVDPDWSRDDATDFIKGLGGRVTTAVSGKTDYLFVMGETLEDERSYLEGSKYKKAADLGTRVIVGRPLLNGVVKFHSDAKGGGAPKTSAPPKNSPVKAEDKPVAVAPTAAKPAVVKNPYARKVTNPYARKPAAPGTSSKPAGVTSNPYATTKKSPPTPVTASSEQPKAASGNSATMLWVDKYKPQSSNDILGNQESVRKLRNWLMKWESLFNKDSVVGKAFSKPTGPWKAVLLSGPPGIGKTTTATLVAQESGRHVLEFNASDVRSKTSLRDDVGDITGSRTIRFGKQSAEPSKRVIIMDEVDGLGAGDRGGLAELIQMIKNSRVPIICICNDRQSQKIKSLVPYCMDLKYSRPRKSQIASRIMEVARKEGFTVEHNAAEMLAESCGNDVRQCLNACQMWASETGGDGRMSYTGLKEREKSINKDEMLRVSLFDATRLILQGRNGLHGATPEAERAHFLKRNDAFFVDYNFTGLMVQQNYLNVMKGPYSKATAAKQTTEVEDLLERMASASEALSDFALAEHKLRSDQNWSVLPFVGSLTVKTGYHAGGENGAILGGFPEFTTWLGKNSSKGKKTRLIQDLQHHMNFRISGGSEEMRLSYLPVLRGRFLSLLQDKDAGSTDEAIALMDTYGLDRDDILEKFDEFKMDPKDKGFAALDSKQKAALTRAYNAVSHKSQALVVEQGGAKKSKRKAASVDELGDPDVVDDDKKIEEEDDENDEPDAEAIASMFKKKGRKPAAKKGSTAKKPPARRKK